MSLDFDEIYSETASIIFRYLRRLTGSPGKAEDILQNTFLKFHLQLQNDVEIENYRAWLFRVATNEVYDRRRSEVRSAIREENYTAGAKMRGDRSNHWMFAAMGIAVQMAQHQADQEGKSTWRIKEAVCGL